MTERDFLRWAFTLLDSDYAGGGITAAGVLLVRATHFNAAEPFCNLPYVDGYRYTDAATLWYRSTRGDLRRATRDMSLDERIDHAITTIHGRRVIRRLRDGRRRYGPAVNLTRAKTQAESFDLGGELITTTDQLQTQLPRWWLWREVRQPADRAKRRPSS